MRSVEHSRTFELPQPVDELFPLFSPEGERHWVPEWEYGNVMGTTELCEGYVFTTQSHDHRESEAVWVVSHYDPLDHRVRFYKVEPGNKVGTVTVSCRSLSENSTRVRVDYRYIALSEAGESFIAEFDAAAYAEYIDEWRELLTRYFANRA